MSSVSVSSNGLLLYICTTQGPIDTFETLGEARIGRTLYGDVLLPRFIRVGARLVTQRAIETVIRCGLVIFTLLELGVFI